MEPLAVELARLVAQLLSDKGYSDPGIELASVEQLRSEEADTIGLVYRNTEFFIKVEEA